MVSVAIRSMIVNGRLHRFTTSCNADASNPFTNGEPLSPTLDYTPYHWRW